MAKGAEVPLALLRVWGPRSRSGMAMGSRARSGSDMGSCAISAFGCKVGDSGSGSGLGVQVVTGNGEDGTGWVLGTWGQVRVSGGRVLRGPDAGVRRSGGFGVAGSPSLVQLAQLGWLSRRPGGY